MEEKQGGAKEEGKDLLEGLDLENITEDEFLDKAVEKIGQI